MYNYAYVAWTDGRTEFSSNFKPYQITSNKHKAKIYRHFHIHTGMKRNGKLFIFIEIKL